MDRDVSANPAAPDDLMELGYMTTLVTTIDGEVAVGFDRTRLERLLNME